MVRASSDPGMRLDKCVVSASMAIFLSVSVGFRHWIDNPSHPQFPAVKGASQSALRPWIARQSSMCRISALVYMGWAPPIIEQVWDNKVMVWGAPGTGPEVEDGGRDVWENRDDVWEASGGGPEVKDCGRDVWEGKEEVCGALGTRLGVLDGGKDVWEGR